MLAAAPVGPSAALELDGTLVRHTPSAARGTGQAEKNYLGGDVTLFLF